jgi:four helix bundle protein
MANFKQLEVWQKAHHATLEIYRLTRSFPQDERFGLVSQMRRAAVSIGSNLAEGRGRLGGRGVRQICSDRSRLSVRVAVSIISG